MRALVIATVAACSSREIVNVEWMPESVGASSAILAVHTGDDLHVFAYALDPRPASVQPELDIDGDVADLASLEILLYDSPLAELYIPEGRIVPAVGGVTFPMTADAFSRALYFGEWQRSTRSLDLEAFTFEDARPDACRDLEAEVMHLDTDIAPEDLVLDDAGTLYALTQGTAGIFRIRDGESRRMDVSPVVDISSGTFAGGRLWIATSSGTIWSGEVTGDRIDLDRELPDGPINARWMLPNPYGQKPLLMNNEANLVDLSTGAQIYTLEASDQTDEGSLIYEGVVYFSTAKSALIGRYDGVEVAPIPIPSEDTGGAVASVPNIGLLVGTAQGQIFRLAGDDLVPFDDLGAPDANTIIPFPGGFVVGSDVGVMYRWVEGQGFCAIATGSAEDLEIGLEYGGGVVFAPNSSKDRKTVGGMTPVTMVRLKQ